MKNIVVMVIVLLSLLLGIIGCTFGATGTLENKTWVLISIEKQGNSQAPIADREVSIVFDGNTGKIAGSGGCNRYFGNYSVQNNTLTISKMGSTMMACPIPPGIMAQEQQFSTALGSAESYSFQGDNLKILCGGGISLLFAVK